MDEIKHLFFFIFGAHTSVYLQSGSCSSHLPPLFVLYIYSSIGRGSFVHPSVIPSRFLFYSFPYQVVWSIQVDDHCIFIVHFTCLQLTRTNPFWPNVTLVPGIWLYLVLVLLVTVLFVVSFLPHLCLLLCVRLCLLGTVSLFQTERLPALGEALAFVVRTSVLASPPQSHVVLSGFCSALLTLKLLCR